jgi:hypothetical protein
MVPVKKILADLLEERKRIDEAIANLELPQHRRERPKMALVPNPAKSDPATPGR